MAQTNGDALWPNRCWPALPRCCARGRAHSGGWGKTAATKISLRWTKYGMKFVLTSALTLNPLPRERKSPLADSGFADVRPANPVEQIFKRTANGSPSPWGEGRVEGGRCTKLQPRGKRSVAVPGHSKARTATRFGQTDARPALPRCCARGRAHSGGQGKTAAAKLILGWTTGANGV